MARFHSDPSVVVVEGRRLPFLRSGTDYRHLTSYDLARMAILGLIKRIPIEARHIEAIILGTVVSNIVTSNVARDAALAAGIPASVPAFTVTQACVSANQAITSGAELIRAGQARLVLAGGTESLSDIPIRLRRPLRDRLVAAQKARSAIDYLKLLRGLSLGDLLPEVPAVAEFSTGRTMGEDCDRLAARFGVTREEQDAYAVRSHHLAAKATEAGLLEPEIETVAVPPDFKLINRDNGIRADTSLEKAAALSPAFVRPHGTVTAANSSFLTDGAAVVLLASLEAARELGLQPKAYLRCYAYTAQDPFEELLLGPAYAIPKVLDASGLTLGDIDVFELHEAFAGQVLANLRCLESDQFAKEKLNRASRVGEIPMEKLNLWGGSLSLGHPFGATGARLVTTAANRLIAEQGRFALVASCAAGGIGNAILLERFQ